jgi:sugar transferase (PEP-CTERM/EpsH1 system associated)
MKVLFLSNWFPYPPDNGARLRVYNLIRQLSNRHEIVLLTFVRDERPETQHTPLAVHCQTVETVPYRPYEPRSLWALIGLLSPRPRYLTAAYSPQMKAVVRRVLQRQHFDVIVASEIGPGTGVSPYVEGVTEIPCVLEDLELSMVQSMIAAQETRWKRWRYQATWWKLQRYVNRVLRRVAGCTVASKAEKELVRRIAPDALPLAVVPNGVDVQAYVGDFGLSQADSLIFSGALSYSANFEAMDFFLSKVYPLIKSRCPGVTLRITGRTDGVPLDRLPQQRGVSFTGYLDDVRPAIARSAVSVVPLRQGGGTRLKILEAMALGTPVVSTAKGAEGLEVTPGRDILIADEPNEFADAVVRLLDHERLCMKISANGRRLVEQQYTWETCARKLEHLLVRVVDQRNRTEC